MNNASPRGGALMTSVAVFGEMLVDQFLFGAVAGGAPFNVARHLAVLGHAPLMLSAVGADANGELLLGEMTRFGMQRHGVQSSHRPTGSVDVHMAANGDHRFQIQSDSAWDFIEEAPVRAVVAGVESSSWLYAGTLVLRGAVSGATALALMRAHPGHIFIDLNWRENHVPVPLALKALKLADVLKVNAEELAMLCQWLGVPAAAGEAPSVSARKLLQRLPLELLLVTCGAEGALAFDGLGCCLADGRDTRPVVLVDTVGAGDSFSAVVIAGLLRGWDMTTTLARANSFAAHICELRGAVPQDLNDYSRWTTCWR